MKTETKGQFIETNCCIKHEGKQFCANGAWIAKRKDTGLLEGILYHFPVKQYNKEGVHCATNHFVGTWDGKVKIHAVLLREWRNNMGDIRKHFFFIYNGMKLWGRNAGDNDIVRCKQYKV